MLESSIDFQLHPSPEALKLIPFAQAKKHRILTIKFAQNTLSVAVSGSTTEEYLNFLKQRFNCEISQILTPSTFLETAIQHYYRKIKPEAKPINLLSDNTPTALLAEKILSDAIEKKCSDIHIEPFREHLAIRYRKDGFLKLEQTLEKYWQQPLIAYLKLKAQLNIAEKRSPQEGNFEYDDFNARLSCVPSLYGETAVVRLLSPASSIPDYAKLGLHYQNEFLENFHRRNGLIVIAGPTGSGKTTTLYSLILHLVTLNKRILTIEDPVEYRLPHVGQINLPTSASIEDTLRAIVRQNIDVLIIGELRSYDRLQVALNAALTGHLVLSTVHAKDAMQAVDRLRNMEASENLLESTLRYVVNQRLIRRLCQRCAEYYQPPYHKSANVFANKNMPSQLKREKGCKECMFTGFDGRTGIFEVFENSPTNYLKGLKNKLRLTGINLSQNVTCLLRDFSTSISEAARFI